MRMIMMMTSQLPPTRRCHDAIFFFGFWCDRFYVPISNLSLGFVIVYLQAPLGPTISFFDFCFMSMMLLNFILSVVKN